MAPRPSDPELRSVLGLPDDADAERVAAAYARVRSRVEARLRDTDDEPTRAARQRELERLEHLLVADGLAGAASPSRPSASGAGAAERPSGPTLEILAASALAVFAAFALGWWIASERAPESGEPVEPSAVAAEAAEEAQPTGPATLSVESVPDGAEFVLEDAAPGQAVVIRAEADGERHEVAAGAYTLRVFREDCPGEWRESLELAPAGSHRVAARICEGEGRLVVRSNVAGDRLKVDGRDLGSTSEHAHGLDVGDHAVRVEKPGYEAWIGEVRLRPDETLTLHAELVPEPSRRKEPAAPAMSAPAPVAVAPAPPSVATSGGLVDARAVGALPRVSDETVVATGGSRAWHDEKARALVARYDQDGSGRLDTLAEADSIPCSEWQALERSYDRGPMVIPMPRLYGFDGSTWRSGALGFDRRIRSHVYERMKSCGLRG